MNRGYEAYKRKFRYHQNKVKALYEDAGKEYEPKEEMYSEEEYEQAYEAARNDRLDEISEGKRRTVGDINEYLARKQSYEYTSKQASAIYKAMEKENPGKEIYWNEIQAGVVDTQDLWTAINKRRQDLIEDAEARNASLEEGELAKIISLEFFGSA